MIRLLIIPLVMLLAQPDVPVNPSEETSMYEVRYILGDLNTKVAKATITTTPTMWEEKDAYKAEINIKVQPFFRLFLHAKYFVEAFVTRPGMQPLYYSTSSSKENAWCRYSEGEEGIVFWRHYKKKEPKALIFPNDGRTMELVSMLYYVRTLDFKEGEPCELKVLIGERALPATLTMEGIDTEKYPGHRAMFIRFVMLERGIMENGSGNEAYLWIDADGSRIPLGLEVALGKRGVMVCNIVE
ncbi:MAG: DUF3108 domain-containing protein [Bacteroidales bacterium]|nr:DUF3108 domain-containing protein [Bacteroidales bacterium]